MEGNPEATLAAIHAAFNEHPADIVRRMAATAQLLAELGAMFDYLRSDLEPASVPRRAQDLVQAGSRLAAEAALQLGHRAEICRERLAAAGVLDAV